MKEQNKILVTILVLVIIILAAFAVIIEYRFGVFAKTDEEKLPIFVKVFAPEVTGTEPFSINYTSLVLYYSGNLKYEWNFGNNETSNEVNPSHVYKESGVYTCTLTVKDGSGAKATDNVQITVNKNEVPNVQIVLSDLNPSRPFVPIIWRDTISKSYNGRTLRNLIDSGLLPKSILNHTGFFTCDAVASSPQGNEIVSYEWIVTPPPYMSRTGQLKRPEYHFYGKNVTIPLLYIYPESTYDLTCIVTDSAGYKGTLSTKFNTQISSTEVKILTVKGIKERFRLQVWLPVLKGLFGPTVGNAIYENLYPALPSFPLLKLAGMGILFVKWGMEPPGSLVFNIISSFLKKHKLIQKVFLNSINKVVAALEKMREKKPKLSGTINNLEDSIQELLENLGFANKRPVISNEVPADKSKHLSTSYPEVAVTVEDPEGDPFNITIHGQYVNNITLLNQHNNTFVATLITPLPNLTDITWHVNVSYSDNRWINATYKFSTW